MEKNSGIFVAGHRGLVGSAIVRKLNELGFGNLILKTRHEVNLTEQAQVRDFFAREKPEYVFLAAARVGGIHANNAYPVEFLRDNLLIQVNIIESAYNNGVKKLLFLGSSCIYPKFAPQPMKEEHLLTGELEPTNEWYAIAKIAGIKTCQAYKREYGFNAISLMPTNLYGPYDNYDLNNSHVLPALIRKFHEAKASGQTEAVVWGTGKARREFLHVDDLADAAVFLMNNYNSEEIINVGTGIDSTIAELAELVKKVVGFEGRLVYDTSKPDGTPRKLLDISRIASMGWKAGYTLEEGIRHTYQAFLDGKALIK